jgi:hypothetical protein
MPQPMLGVGLVADFVYVQGSRCPSHLSHFAIFWKNLRQKSGKCDMDISYFRLIAAILNSVYDNKVASGLLYLCTMQRTIDLETSCLFNNLQETKG